MKYEREIAILILFVSKILGAVHFIKKNIWIMVLMLI